MTLSLILILLLVLADRGLKIWLTRLLAEGPVVLIRGVIGLRYTENTGAAFSMLSEHTWILIVFTMIAVAVLLVLLYRNRSGSRLMKAALILIIAGGLGNLYDRIFQGFVVDYIEVLLFRYTIFNFADCLVCVGAALLLIYLIFFDRDTTEKKLQADKPAEEQTAEEAADEHHE